MQYPPEKWRNVYKALQVLEFVLKRGGEEAIEDAKLEFPELLEGLTSFSFIGPDGRDYGVNIRVRASAVEKLLQDDALLKSERQKLRKFSCQLKGYTRAEMQEQSGTVDCTRSNSWGGGDLVQRDPSENIQHPEREALNRGAGEMKGVSLHDNKKNLAELKRVLSRAENKICADCHEQMPTWASINCGVFICLKCSGIHRGLGVHISKVRSCTLDTWLPEQIDFLSRTGNAVANAYWEATLQAHQRPTGDVGLATFITEKYTHKKFASGTWPPENNRAEGTVQHPVPVTGSPTVERTVTRTALEIGPQKTTNQATPSDLLKFEDEAFAFEGPTTEFQEGKQTVGSADWAELVAEEAAEHPSHRASLSFENSALFEQRSSFLRMRSRLSNVQAEEGASAEVPLSPPPKRTTEYSFSLSFSLTTLLDFDDLESVSESMSFASQKLLFPGLPSRTAVNGNRPQTGRPPTPDTAPSKARLSTATAVASPSHATIQQRRSAPPPAPPVLDLLDAPLSVLPVAVTESFDQSADPFSFMSSLEPLTIVHDETPQEAVNEVQVQAQLASVSQPEPAIVPELQPNPENSFVVASVGSIDTSASMAPARTESKGGTPMNKMTAMTESQSASDGELKRIQDLSRLDQLFVQQVEDFLHFGYNWNMYHKPSYL